MDIHLIIICYPVVYMVVCCDPVLAQAATNTGGISVYCSTSNITKDTLQSSFRHVANLEEDYFMLNWC